MAHLLLLALCVATSNSIALHAPARVKTLGATRSALALLKAGDFEHLARQFSNSEGILALTLPGSRQRCLVIHESRADLARRMCASSVLKDRVAGDVAFPGLTRQRDGERYAAAKTALNSALCGDRQTAIGQTAFAAAFDADHIHDDDAYALCVARMALRATLFGDDEDTATAFLGPRTGAATPAAAPPPPRQSAARARLRVAARQAKLLMSGAPFFEVVDGFTNVDAKTLRARRGVRNPAPAAAAAFRAETEARREAAIAARRRGGAGADARRSRGSARTPRSRTRTWRRRCGTSSSRAQRRRPSSPPRRSKSDAALEARSTRPPSSRTSREPVWKSGDLTARSC